MTRIWVPVIWLGGLLRLAAQEAPVLPDIHDPQVPAVGGAGVGAVPLPDGAGPLQPALPKELKINSLGSPSFDSILRTVNLGGPVKVSGDNGMEIFADRATWRMNEECVDLEGNVSVYQGDILQRGERAVYYYQRKFLDASRLAIAVDSVIMESGKFSAAESAGRTVFTGENAGITLHDSEYPDFWLQADHTTVYPGKKVVFKDLKVVVGDTPVFWLPYLSQPLDSELGYHFIPGVRSAWGAYLLNTYGTMLGGTPDPVTGDRPDAWLLAKWRLDLMTYRGVGTGVNLSDIRAGNRENLTGLSLYYLHDLDPDRTRSGVPRGRVDADRYEIALKHRLHFDLPDQAAWYLDTNLHRLSDDYYLEDFQPDFYHTNPQPDNIVGLFRRDETSLFSAFARIRVNDFHETATRLPELAFDQSLRPLGGLPVLHEGTTSFGVLGAAMDERLRWETVEPLLALPPGDPREAGYLARLSGTDRALAVKLRALPPGDPQVPGLRRQLFDTGFTRFHTFQDFSLPFTVGDWLNLTPSAGVGLTSYGAVAGPATGDTLVHLHAGLEASVKFSSQLGDLTRSDWGLDGVLHVFQPYAQWSVLATDAKPALYPQVDRLTFSTRPPTLAPVRYTAVDDLHNWNIVRFGARNQLLTRRDGQAHEWLFMDTYIDAYLNDPEMDRTFSNLYNDLRFSPVPWISVDLETQFPLAARGSGYDEVAALVRVQPTPDSEFAVGYRWLHNHPVLEDSSRIDLRGYLRVNENWGVSAQQIWETDDGTLEHQLYSVHRDLGSWVLGMGISSRDNRVRSEWGVMFSLTFKDFPSLSLPFSVDAY